MMTLQEQRRHYVAVRARLWTPKAAAAAAPKIEKRPSPRFTFKPDYRPPGLTLARYYAGEFARWKIPSMPPKARMICLAVCRRTNTTFEAMASPARYHTLVLPRQRLFHALYKGWTGASMPKIGQLVGGRDHTTVLHGIRREEARRSRG